MKKTLFSTIAGLAIIGSASAIPTPNSAKKHCSKPNIWVEKTAECLSENPCIESTEKKISSEHCIAEIVAPSDESIQKIWLDKFTENVFKTTVKEINLIKDKNTLDVFLGVHTNDGNYFAIGTNKTNVDTTFFRKKCSSNTQFALNAYGYGFGLGKEYEFIGGALGIKDNAYKISNTPKDNCTAIKKFADTLAQQDDIVTLNYDEKEKSCTFQCKLEKEYKDK
ncbi:MAG: hypothetical protein K5912_00745 [Alphaproteobacteria bacterium]|nr:hypothetical protein [Alphaproteobacteria bacterium]